MERAGGYSDDCCLSFGKMVEIAGGTNMAKDIIPGTFGAVNPEQIIASNPDQVIITVACGTAMSPAATGSASVMARMPPRRTGSWKT